MVVRRRAEGGDVERRAALAELEPTLELADLVIFVGRVGHAAVDRADSRGEQDLVRIGARAPAVAGEDREGLRDAVVDARRVAPIAVVVVDRRRLIERQIGDAGFRCGDDAVAVDVVADQAHPAAAEIGANEGTAYPPAIIAHAAADRELADMVVHRAIGRENVIRHVEDAAEFAAVAAEGVIAVLRLRDAGSAGDVDHRRLRVARHIGVDARMQPGRVELLVRLVEAAGNGEVALADLPDAGGADVVGEVVERTDPRLRHIVERKQPVAIGVDRHQLADVRPAGIGRHRAGAGLRRGDRRDRRDVGGEDAQEVARIHGVTRAFADREAGDVELRLQPDRLALGVHAVGDVEPGELVVGVQRRHRADKGREQRVLADVEAVHAAHDRIVVRAGDPDRVGREGGRAIVQPLAADADIAGGELLGHVEAELPALIAGEADVARALARAIIAADMEAPAIADRLAIIHVHALLAIIEPGGELHRAAARLAGLRDQVDQAARRVGREGRARAAADRLDRRHIEIGAHEHVDADVEDVAELEHRQPVFLELHVFRATGRERQTAHSVVGVALADAAFDAQARHGAQHVTQRARAELLEFGGAERAGRCGAVQSVAALGDPGGEDLFLGYLRSLGGLGVIPAILGKGRMDDGARAEGEQEIAKLHDNHSQRPMF